MIIADIAALRASWGYATELVRHRQLAVATAAAGQPVLLTRIRLSGETETSVLRGWLNDTAMPDVDATVQRHFAAVAAATAGWPASLGMVRLGSRVAGLGGSLAVVVQVVRALVRQGTAALPHLAVTNWPLLAGLAFALVGLIVRPLLRHWLRAMIRRVPLRVPAPS